MADELRDVGMRLHLASLELRRAAEHNIARVAPPEPPVQYQPVQPVPVAPQPVPVQPAAFAASPPMVDPAPAPFVSPIPYPTQPPPSLEEARQTGLAKQGAGSRLVSWIGGGVTLLGLVLLVVLVVQRGWLGPLPRVVIGALFGSALVGIALWVRTRPGGKAAGFALAATGVAALYLDVVAATSLYEYLPPAGGLAAGLLVAGAGLWLANRWDAQPLAIGAVLGCAACAPLLTKDATPLLVGFLMMLNAAAAPVQLRRGWPGLTAAAALPAIVAALVADGRGLLLADRIPTVWAALGASALGMVLAALGSRRRPEDPVQLIVLLAAPAPALVSAALLGRVGATLVAAAVAGLGLAAWAAKPWLPANCRWLGAAIGLVGIFQAVVTGLDGSARSITLLAGAAVLALLAVRLGAKGLLIAAPAFGLVGTVLALIKDVPPRILSQFPAPSYLVGKIPEPTLLITGVGAGVAMAAFAVALPVAALRLGVLAGPAQRDSAAVGAWVVSGIGALYGAASAVMCAALLAGPDRGGFLVGHMLITISWTVAALGLLLRGIRSAHLRACGVVLLSAALAKLFLFDLAALDGLPRVVAFLGAGLVLLAAGTRYARLVAAAREPAPTPADVNPS